MFDGKSEVFRRIFFIVILFTGIFFFTVSLPAEVSFPRLTSDDFYSSYTNRTEPLPADRISEIALFVSGVELKNISEYQNKIELILAEINDFVDFSQSTYHIGEEILEYLHSDYLTRYDEFQTRLDVLLDTGKYNCVSSAVLYFIILRNYQIQVTGVATKDHVFCSVFDGKNKIDVETTNPYGFDPGRRKEFSDAFGKTGFSYVPPGNYSLRWEVEERKFLSYILQNRIAELEKKKLYSDAVELSVDRYALSGDADSFKEMFQEFVNYAGFLNENKEYSSGIAFIELAAQEYGLTPELLNVSEILINNKIVKLIRNRNFHDAYNFLLESKGRGILSDSRAKELEELVTERYLYAVVNEETMEEALSVVDAYYINKKIDNALYVEYIVFIFGKKAELLSQEGKWPEALILIEQGIERIGMEPRFQKAVETFSHNYFAELFNTKKYDRAKEIIQEGLEQYPESRLLKRDMQALEKAGF